MSDTPGPAPAPTPIITPAPVITEERETVPVMDDGDHDRFAHIVRKDDQMKGYVMGEAVTVQDGRGRLLTIAGPAGSCDPAAGGPIDHHHSRQAR